MDLCKTLAMVIISFIQVFVIIFLKFPDFLSEHSDSTLGITFPTHETFTAGTETPLQWVAPVT